jgi:hypothetical protein
MFIVRKDNGLFGCLFLKLNDGGRWEWTSYEGWAYHFVSYHAAIDASEWLGAELVACL